MIKLFDLLFCNNIIAQAKPMNLVCSLRNNIIKEKYPQSKIIGYKNFYHLFKIQFNNSNYKPKNLCQTENK